MTDSTKVGPVEMRQYVNDLALIQRAIDQGAITPADLRAMRTSGSSDERRVGEAYHHFFNDGPLARPVRAEWVDGVGLVPQEGRHRVEAARQAGLSTVPVLVSARNPQDLARIVDAMHGESAALQPRTAEHVRDLDGRRQAVVAGERVLPLERSREFLQERER